MECVVPVNFQMTKGKIDLQPILTVFCAIDLKITDCVFQADL